MPDFVREPLKDERGGITDATFAKDFVRKLRRSLAMAVFRKNTNDPVNDDNPTVVRARAIEEEDLQRLGQPQSCSIRSSKRILVDVYCILH